MLSSFPPGMSSIEDFYTLQNYYNIQGERKKTPPKSLMGNHRQSNTEDKSSLLQFRRKDVQRQFIFSCALRTVIEILDLVQKSHLRFQSEKSRAPKHYSILCPGNASDKKYAILKREPIQSIANAYTGRISVTGNAEAAKVINRIYMKILFSVTEFYSRQNQLNLFLMASLFAGEKVKGITSNSFNTIDRSVRLWRNNHRKYAADIKDFIKKSKIINGLVSENLEVNYFSKHKGFKIPLACGIEPISIARLSDWSEIGNLTLDINDWEDVPPSFFFSSQSGKINESTTIPPSISSKGKQIIRDLRTLPPSSMSGKGKEPIRDRYTAPLPSTPASDIKAVLHSRPYLVRKHDEKSLELQIPLYDFIYDVACKTIQSLQMQADSALCESSDIHDSDDLNYPSIYIGEFDDSKNYLVINVSKLKNSLVKFKKNGGVLTCEHPVASRYLKELKGRIMLAIVDYLTEPTTLNHFTSACILLGEDLSAFNTQGPKRRQHEMESYLSNPAMFKRNVQLKLAKSKLIGLLINKILIQVYSPQMRKAYIQSPVTGSKVSIKTPDALEGLGVLKINNKIINLSCKKNLSRFKPELCEKPLVERDKNGKILRNRSKLDS